MITTVESKQMQLKDRRKLDLQLEQDVDKLTKQYHNGGGGGQGCGWRALTCGLFYRRESLHSVDVSQRATAANTTGSKFMNRLVGRAKADIDESKKIEEASKIVESRIDALKSKMAAARASAIKLKQTGNAAAALKEVKKLKAIEKQLDVARAASDALERQFDLLEQTVLQRELASALASSSKAVKKKHKGLLNMAESAVDEATEVADDAEDIGNAFDGLVPNSTINVDDAELLDELNAMMGDEPQPTATPETWWVPTAHQTDTATANSFPVAPNRPVGSQKKEEKTALLAAS